MSSRPFPVSAGTDRQLVGVDPVKPIEEILA